MFKQIRTCCNTFKTSVYYKKIDFNLYITKLQIISGLFGIRKYGVDINGYTNDPVKGLSVWLQKRSPNKQTWPSYWDNCVSGGLSVGFGILETAIKEAGEEAGIPLHLLGKLKSAGCISVFFESELGLFANTEFVFDLELPPDFVPNNSDGEVETFELLTVNECIERIISPHFKTTASPVALDFLIRHGCITPENGMFSLTHTYSLQFFKICKKIVL